MKQVKTKMNGTVEIHEDELYVEMFSALGSSRGNLNVPLKMREHLVKAYIDSGVVKSDYMYLDGEEVSDGLNHNPFRGL